MSLSSSSSGARAVFPSRASVHPDPHGGENYEPGNQSTGSWIHQLPLWLKSLALGSILLLTFSIIFVSVAAVLTANLEVPRGNVDAVGTSRRTLDPVLRKSLSPSSPMLSSYFPSFAPTKTLSGIPSTNPSPLPPSTISGHSSPVPSSPSSPRPSKIPSITPTILSSWTPSTSSTVFSYAPSIVVSRSTSPTSNIATSFFVIGGRAKKTDDFLLTVALKSNYLTQGEFLVHLGDFNNPRLGCRESIYRTFQSQIVHSPAPVFVTPGDNEWNECENPEEAKIFWKRYLTTSLDEHYRNEDDHPRPISFPVTRQPSYEENFSFNLRDVLYVGINLVGGPVLDAQAWASQTIANLSWIETQTEAFTDRHQESVKALVIFGNSNRRKEYKDFFLGLAQLVDVLAIPTVYIHNSTDKSSLIKRALGKRNLWILRVQSSTIPFIRVTVDTMNASNPFTFQL